MQLLMHVKSLMFGSLPPMHEPKSARLCTLPHKARRRRGETIEDRTGIRMLFAERTSTRNTSKYIEIPRFWPWFRVGFLLRHGIVEWYWIKSYLICKVWCESKDDTFCGAICTPLWTIVLQVL
jgi:hypothetical protein